MPVKVHEHTISVHGLAGGIFISLLIAAIMYAVGFATSGWTVTSLPAGYTREMGLWKDCTCHDVLANSTINAVRAMIIIGLVGLAVSIVAVIMYLFIDGINKTITLAVLCVALGAGVLFMVIGYIIWGVEYKQNVGFSFIINVIGGCFTFIALIVTLIQFQRANMCCC